MSTILLPFASNALTTYVYEPFSYTISNPPGSSTLAIGTTAGIPAGYLVNNGSNVVFSTTSNGMVAGTSTFNIQSLDASGVLLATSSNIVTVNSGRFLDASGSSYAGRSFTFYKNEPITSIPLVAPFGISTPTTVPTLPPGLSYVSNASNSFSIAGTPLVTVPQSNYLVIGKGSGSNLGKTVTSQFGISISNERIVTNLDGSPIVSPMTIDTPITPRTITAAYPPYPYGGTLRYTWFGLPDGIVATDFLGTTVSSPFTPFDPSATLIFKGTPTLAAANAYKAADITSNVVTFNAIRTNPLPQISNTVPVTFGFGETVLFDSVTVPTLYSGVHIDPSATYFRAQTYFGSNAAITNMFSPDLRADLSIAFVAGTGRGYLIDTSTSGPIGTGSATYTIRAVNSNAVTRDLLVPITVTTDSVSFVTPTPAVDTCYNFVLSRPITSFLTGYYTSNIEFKALAASCNAVTFSSSGLAGTGLSLSNVNSNTARLVGIPTTVTSLTTATVTASAVGTPAVASTSIKFAILNDTITFSQPTVLQLSFVQNRAITPIQLTATTKSDRPVISFTSTNMPTGLSISTTGLITGTPRDNPGTPPLTFNVTASTGFMSQTETYTYTLAADSIILVERPEPSYTLTLGGSVPAATVSGLSYSGTGVSNFVFSNLPQTYGMTIGNTTGVFGGTFTTSFPPDPVLPPNVSFSVYASAGLLTAGISAEINTTNSAKDQWFILRGTTIGNSVQTLNSWSNITSGLTSEIFTDYSIRPYTIETRSIVAVTGTREVLQTENGSSFTKYTLPPTTALNPTFGAEYNTGPRVIVRSPSTPSTLYGAGYDNPYIHIGMFWKSTDNGITWSSNYPIYAAGGGGTYGIPDAFSFGNAITYKDGILLIGGQGGSGGAPPGPTGPPLPLNKSIARSTDFGDTWTAIDSFTTWTSEFNTEASRWIAAGSDGFEPGIAFNPLYPTTTLRYSDDQGLTWTTGTGSFNFIAEFLAYGNGIWMAGGRHYDYGDSLVYAAIASSTDGETWTIATLSVPIYPYDPAFIPADDADRSTHIQSVIYDGTDFVVIVTDTYETPSIPIQYSSRALTHAADGSSFDTGWTSTTLSTLPTDGTLDFPLRLKGRYEAATGTIVSILSFPTQASNGPTVTSPTNTSILLYQYAPMTPVQFSATGTGTIYFFVRDAELPVGLTFNSVTNTLSGTPMRLGTTYVTIYVKDSIGVTLLTLQFRVIIPVVERQQTSAGAWTSLVRQYTVVNAAQNSLNGRALPASDSGIGEFMRPYPPDESNDPACKKC